MLFFSTEKESFSLRRASASPLSKEAKNAAKSDIAALSLPDVKTCIDEWLLDCELRQHTRKTISSRRDVMNKFVWFMESHGHVAVGSTEIKAFLIYLGVPQSRGRWDNPRLTQPMRPVSVHRYYREVKTLFGYAEQEGFTTVNLTQRIKPPVVRLDTKEPPSSEHLQMLLKAAKNSTHPKRDAALLWFLADTGLRAAEVCGLTISDVDMVSRLIKVRGKGNKMRFVPFGITVAKALLVYLRVERCGVEAPLFRSHSATALTVSGLYQIVKRISQVAGVPCLGLHSMRRYFAVSLLRSGANVFTVQAMLGHSDLSTTKRYVAVAQSDIVEQHRQFSPCDRLPRKLR